MKKYLLFASAVIALASCTTDTYIGDQDPSVVTGEKAINFSSGLNAITRADKTGSAAAEDLNNQFFVYAIKKESDDGAGNVQTGNLVFNNYVVKWTANSAMTTTSNTENWEYVGYTLTAKEQAKVTANSGAVAQTIKYWDWGAANYTFYAFSALPADIEGDKITVTKVQDQTSAFYDNGYTVTLAAGASLDDLYFSERTFISNTNNTGRTEDNKYGGNVTFRFHNMASKVRVAMYETIPGYSVKINSFKVTDAASPAFSAMTTEKTANFAANFVNNASGTKGNMTVKYIATAGATQNHPTVTFTPRNAENTADVAPANILELGDQLKATVTIGESATGATYDKAEKAYTSVFPKENNAQNLKLKVCYTLTAPVTGETITVTDAMAEVPAEYLKWKPGYAYTYIFKISDNTNGSTGTPGTNPAGLYPITFDAVEVIADDGQAEYITTVSEPTITTFGAIYNTTSSKYTSYQTGKNEYQAQTSPNQLDIFATFMEGSTEKTPVLTGDGKNVKIFAVTTTDATNFPITEASVAEAAANPNRIINPVWTCAVTDVTAKAATDLTNEGTYYKKDANNKAPGDAGYVPTLAVKGTDYTIGATSAENTIAEGVNIYTCTVTYTSVASPAALTTGTTYYKSDGSHNPGTTDYVPTVAATGTDYQVAPKVAVTDITTSTSTDYFTGGTAPAKVTTVPGEDGVNKTINAVKLTGVKAGTYAIEYEASTAWTGSYTKVYKVIVVQ